MAALLLTKYRLRTIYYSMKIDFTMHLLKYHTFHILSIHSGLLHTAIAFTSQLHDFTQSIVIILIVCLFSSPRISCRHKKKIYRQTKKQQKKERRKTRRIARAFQIRYFCFYVETTTITITTKNRINFILIDENFYPGQLYVFQIEIKWRSEDIRTRNNK